METKINLIEILKDKPLNFKLYDAVRNIDVFLDEVLENINEIRCKLDEDGHRMIYYSHKGTLIGFEDGIVALVPSKGMRDWKKFLWKKGDVLVSNNGKTEIIFDKFDDDSYTMFSGKHGLDCTNGTRYDIDASDWLPTDCFNKESEDAAKTYISIIERRLGGKLNLETLKIEKTHSEFKDGDIVAVDLYRKNIRIFKEKKNENNFCWGKYYIGFSFNNEGKLIQTFKNYTADSSSDRLATEEEKQQLFSVLEKEGMAWDAEPVKLK